MEANLFVISVKIGQQMRFEFEGTLIAFDPEKQLFTFGEVTEDDIPKKDGDIIVLDFMKKKVSLNSQHFIMAIDILYNQEIGGNYYFKCATDLSKVDVYICEKELWNDKGESIFS